MNNLEWAVGDIVQIVDEPYRESPACWVPQMDETCGYEVRIVLVAWEDDDDGHWQLCQCEPVDPMVDSDMFCWNYCSNCFIPIQPCFDTASEIDIKDLFGMG